MKVAVISDLHLGVGDRADRSGHDPGRFLTFLQFLEGNFERIVLLGDIWDPMTTPGRVEAREGLRLCREAHPALAQRFEKRPYVYVHGNHDQIAGQCEGVSEEHSIEADGIKMVFTHGHHHDVLMRKAPWLTNAAIRVGACMMRARLGSLYDVAEHLDTLRNGVSKRPEACSFQRWAVGKARERRADVVVTGHTHLALKAPHDDVLFLNSGSCSVGRFTFLSLDTRQGAYAVNTSWS